jgi:hypothetical protein
MTTGEIVLRIGVAILLMIVVAGIAYVGTRGHLFLFPFVLILGLPLLGLFRRPSGS